VNNDGGPGYVDQGEDPLLREGEVLSIHAGVNFINVLRKHFSYERHFGSFLYVHVTREKLPKQRSYEKFLQKLLMKLTTGVNFINILCRHLLYERLFSAYNLALNELSCLKFAQKMLMKLNTGLNYKLICR